MVTVTTVHCSGVSICWKDQLATSAGFNFQRLNALPQILCDSVNVGCHKFKICNSLKPTTWQGRCPTVTLGSIQQFRSIKDAQLGKELWNKKVLDIGSVQKKIRCVPTSGIFEELMINIEKGAHQVASFCISTFICGSTALLLCSNPALAGADVETPVNNDEVELLPIPNAFPPLKDIQLPAFEKVVLSNGLRIYMLEDHELGLVGGELLVKGGSKNDPDEKIGLATIASIVQRSGGSRNHPAETLDRRLEEIAAIIETGSSVSEMSVGFRCLTEDLKEVMSLFSEVVQSPLLPKNKIDFARTQLMGSIKNRGDNPGGIASREFSKVLYGEKSVYSRQFNEKTLNSIKHEDVLAFHRATFSPGSSVLGIWGDFDKETVKKMISSTFGVWNVSSTIDSTGSLETQSDSLLQLETGISQYGPKIFVVDKPGLSQGFIRMGELGTTLSDPDVFALDVLNNILNGFGGLLFDQVRSIEGLAYSVYGGWSPAVEHRGSFVAGGETQISNVPQFILSVERVLQNVIEKPPSEEALKKAKESIINSFVFNFVDSGTQLARIMTYDLFGVDQNFIFHYKKNVEKLKPDDILEAAKTHLHPDAQPILVVADVAEIKSALQSLRRDVVILHPDYLP